MLPVIEDMPNGEYIYIKNLNYKRKMMFQFVLEILFHFRVLQQAILIPFTGYGFLMEKRLVQIKRSKYGKLVFTV